MNNSKIFITGGSGFIGYYLSACGGIKKRPFTIYGLVEPEFRHSASYVKGDVRDREALRRFLKGHDIVFHLAAKHHDFGISRSEYMDTNEGGAISLVRAAEETEVKKIVFLSSVAVYGDRDEPTTEDTPLEPTNPYGESKLAAARVFLDWANKRPDRCLIIIRPTVVFGPRNRANMYNLI